ncbi:universal stress protein [Bordetella genomosp. 5]|uniref:Universal stress protein n=1 Tax=Bordetella genomosp. 5 TaxID=1395608 RepID=A0A261TAS8_9BORD|nr:universal stress protein [Bordetella genomosp. 5]OZI45743.1 universal stress protein [Bordetella genomosp. 5]
MKDIVIPVDGSEHALHALRVVLDRHLYPAQTTVHLVTVLPTLVRQGLHLGLTQEDIDTYQREEAEFAFEDAVAVLKAAGQPYDVHQEIGPVAESIVRRAETLDAGEIVMGTRGLGGIPAIMLGSIATKVLHLSPVPVTLVK